MTNRTRPTRPVNSQVSPGTSLVKRHSLVSRSRVSPVSPSPASPVTSQVKSRRASRKMPLGDSLLQFFAIEHPREDLGRPFADLAQIMVNVLPRNPERTLALRKLLEAKDCALRARLYLVPSRGG